MGLISWLKSFVNPPKPTAPAPAPKKWAIDVHRIDRGGQEDSAAYFNKNDLHQHNRQLHDLLYLHDKENQMQQIILDPYNILILIRQGAKLHPEVMAYAVDKKPELLTSIVEHYPDQPNETFVKAITKNPQIIGKFKKPPADEYINLAITLNCGLMWIKNPTEAQVILAIEHSKSINLNFIMYYPLTDKLWKLAIDKHGAMLILQHNTHHKDARYSGLVHVDLSPDIQMYAVQNQYECIRYIAYPTPEVLDFVRKKMNLRT